MAIFNDHAKKFYRVLAEDALFVRKHNTMWFHYLEKVGKYILMGVMVF